MEDLLLAAEVVLPLLVYMAVGAFARRMSVFSAENFKALNHLNFRIFIPLTLFFNIYEADLGEVAEPGIFAFVFVMIVLQFAVIWAVFSRTVKDRPDAASLIQGTYRSNYVLFGNMIADSLCGETGLALTAALAVLVVPVFNILAVILFEAKRGGRVSAARLIVNIFRNPLVDAGLLGCLFKLLRIQIPGLLQQPLAALGDIATPLALTALGGILSFGSIVKHRKYLAAAAFGKLLAAPVTALAAAAAFGYGSVELAAVLAVFASPTASASTPMAQSMGGNGELAGEIVAVTSVCSMASIFLIVFCLSRLGFI